MSSIIKKQKIRSESIIDFSCRQLIESDNKDLVIELEESSKSESNDISLVDKTTNESQFMDNLEEKFRTKEEIQEYTRKQLHEIQELIDLKLREADEQISRKYAELVLKTKNEEDEIEEIKKAILFEAEVEKQKILSEALSEAENIKKEAIEDKKELLLSSEDEIVKTIAYLVETIISDELKYDTRWLKLLVKKMIYKHNLIGEVSIRLSPLVYASLSEKDIREIEKLKDRIKIIQDEMVNETMFIVDCEQGTINYDVNQGLQTVLQNIRILLESK